MHEKFMNRAFELAENGRGNVAPNPLVGAVIVKDNLIIGEGYHKKYGELHAEINAINDAGSDNYKDTILYVTLEPCFHEGKTPPCVDAVIEAGFKKVVIAILDPNPLTNGRSVSKMLDAGLEVEVGVGEDQALKQNEVFFKYITTGMPFIIMKVAQTLDSKIADDNKHSHWITGDRSRAFVHKMRFHYDAVMIGGGTAIVDNPRLTVRHVEGKDPYRIVLHSRAGLNQELLLLSKNEDKRTIVVTPPGNTTEYKKIDGLTVWEVDKYENGWINLSSLFIKAGKEKISSILIEGGSRLFSSLLKRKLVDKLFIAIAPKIMGGGISALNDLGIDTLNHSIELNEIRYVQRGNDIWVSGYPVWK